MNKDYIIKDSGKRAEFSTGAIRDTSEGKGRFDLLPLLTLQDLALHYEKGACKYSDRNWEAGIPTSRMYDSAMRHAIQFFLGKEDEDHLIAAIWNLIGLREIKNRIDLGILPEEIDDIPYLLKNKKRKGADLVQIRNPKTGSYVKIDRTLGKIISSRKDTPYDDIPIVGVE